MKTMARRSTRAKRTATALAMLAVGAAAIVSGTTPAYAVPSNPDAEPCDPDPFWVGHCLDEDWPPPQQYRVTGRDRSPTVAANEAVALAESHCSNYDVVRVQLSLDGDISVFTITFTCP